MKTDLVSNTIDSATTSPQIHRNHTKNTKSEMTLNRCLSIEVQEQIREYLKKNQEANLPILKLKHSKDISHIRDSKNFNYHPYNSPLPKDLDQLRLSIERKNSEEGLQTSRDSRESKFRKCKYSGYVGMRGSKTIECLETHNSYRPTGRKEAENLLSWYQGMKNKHESHEDFGFVIAKCKEEVIRQISVECKDRGEILKLLFNDIQDLLVSKDKRHEEFVNNIKSENEKKIEKIKVQHNERIDGYKKKIIELSSINNESDKVIAGIKQEAGTYKRKFFEIQKLYLDEKKKNRNAVYNGETRNSRQFTTPG